MYCEQCHSKLVSDARYINAFLNSDGGVLYFGVEVGSLTLVLYFGVLDRLDALEQTITL